MRLFWEGFGNEQGENICMWYNNSSEGSSPTRADITKVVL